MCLKYLLLFSTALEGPGLAFLIMVPFSSPEGVCSVAGVGGVATLRSLALLGQTPTVVSDISQHCGHDHVNHSSVPLNYSLFCYH